MFATGTRALFDDNSIEGLSKDDRGAIMLDATVLFAVDSAELSSDGKTNLKKVIDAYDESVSAEDGKILVNIIIVEGHSDPVGSLIGEKLKKNMDAENAEKEKEENRKNAARGEDLSEREPFVAMHFCIA